MHYHLEIIMPPTDNIKEAIAEILTPFQEGDDEERGRPAFYDWYVIGGRWSGVKLEAQFPEEQMQNFYTAMREAKIMVSGPQCGKEEFAPSSQVEAANALWREHFPDGGKVCPVFPSYGDRYEHNTAYPDVMTVKELPEGLSAAHVIVAGPDFSESDHLEAVFMIQDQMWNGVTRVDVKWDKKVSSALEMHTEKAYFCPEITVKDDWLCVTVDYHG